MNENFKPFITAVAKDLGMSPNEVALECIAATMNLKTMAKYLKGAVPPCKFALSEPVDATADLIKVEDLKAENEALKAEIEALKAAKAAKAPKAPKAAKEPKAPKAPKAAKEPKAENEASSIADTGTLKAIIIDGTETPVRAWGSGMVHMVGLLVQAGQKGNVPAGWFRDEAILNRTATLPSGDIVFTSIVAKDCEKRIRKVAELLGLKVTLRIRVADDKLEDVAL